MADLERKNLSADRFGQAARRGWGDLSGPPTALRSGVGRTGATPDRGLSARTAAEQLTRSLLALAARGQRPRCSDPETHNMWLSDNHEERATAASWCAGCAILDVCASAAEAAGEKFGVWGGKDRTRPAKRTTRNDDQVIA